MITESKDFDLTLPEDMTEFWKSLGIDFKAVMQMATSGQEAATILGFKLDVPFVVACLHTGAAMALAGIEHQGAVPQKQLMI